MTAKKYHTEILWRNKFFVCFKIVTFDSEIFEVNLHMLCIILVVISYFLTYIRYGVIADLFCCLGENVHYLLSQLSYTDDRCYIDETGIGWWRKINQHCPKPRTCSPVDDVLLLLVLHCIHCYIIISITFYFCGLLQLGLWWGSFIYLLFKALNVTSRCL